jgi:hypothetical protein
MPARVKSSASSKARSACGRSSLCITTPLVHAIISVFFIVSFVITYVILFCGRMHANRASSSTRRRPGGQAAAVQAASSYVGASKAEATAAAEGDPL